MGDGITHSIGRFFLRMVTGGFGGLSKWRFSQQFLDGAKNPCGINQKTPMGTAVCSHDMP